MGGYYRLKPTTVPESQRRAHTCTTLGCPDAAIVIVPLNEGALYSFEQQQSYSSSNIGDVRKPARHFGQSLQMRLCRRCVRTLATALPPGQRLPGALLRYPEIDPKIAACEDIPGTPEHKAREGKMSGPWTPEERAYAESLVGTDFTYMHKTYTVEHVEPSIRGNGLYISCGQVRTFRKWPLYVHKHLKFTSNERGR